MKNNLNDFIVNPFELFDKQGALVCAGSIFDHNAMTISWGSLGTLWHRDIVTIYIKPCRYTYSYLERNDYFVVSFFEEKYRDSLEIMGSKSGRDVNKDELAKLTPYEYNGVTLYREAYMSFICKKIYQNDLVLENIPEIEIKRHYQKEAPHRMYIGEIIEVIK